MPSDKNPLVSAIITTHNRADLLPRALRSVLNQSYSPIETMVVDDASTDDTEAVVQDLQQHDAIRYLKNEQSLGAAGARNRGIEAANGEFIAGLDDDDEWNKDRINELVNACSDNYGFVTSDTTMVFGDRKAVWKKKKIIDLNDLLFTNLVGNQVLARRERLLAVGGFDTALEAIEDYDLWIRLCAAYGPVRNVQQPLQTIYMNHQKGRITEGSFVGFLQFYQKNKFRMNRAQRKYQLFNIRRMQGKPITASEWFRMVPTFRYLKELKQFIAEKKWRWQRA